MNLNTKFPLYLPGVSDPKNQHISILAANIREDSTCIAHYLAENGNLILQKKQSFSTEEFSGLPEILRTFVDHNTISGVERLGISVPGPVFNGRSEPQRIGWIFDEEEIRAAFSLEKVYLLNDQEAAAYGIAMLQEDDLEAIYTNHQTDKGNLAILAPGNGLGEAGYFFDGAFLRPFATEGGHSEFSPRTAVEVEFYQFLNNIYGIVSWENVLSKTGLFNIYRFLRDVKRHPEPEWLAKRLALAKGNFTEEIYRAAIEEDVLICKIALDTFLEFLAREANNLTLKLKATGGLLIAGDIPKAIKNYINKEKFYEKFKISDKMENMLKNIPIYIIDSEHTSINGAALYTAFYH